MKPTIAMFAAISAVGALTVACGPGDLDAVTKDDTPDLSDLINKDDGGAAAAGQVGEPATLLAMAQDQGETVRSNVASVLQFVHDATANDPTVQGKNVLNQPFARWDIHGDLGLSLHVFAIRTEPDRVRIIVQGEKDALSLPLMTGVFVKKAPRVGGGRFDLSFTNISQIFDAPGQGTDGSLHFLFANVRPDLHGRRVAYIDVIDHAKGQTEPQSFVADLVRLVGVGGRFRSIYAADIAPQLPGFEAVGMRVAWLKGLGGRADAVIATQANGGQILAISHECWDNDGLRTAYQDSVAGNDSDANAGPDSGDVAHCNNLDDSTVDSAAVQNNTTDTDPDLDSALDDAGATGVTDDEASDASVPDPA
ncbi:MAG TPA: hypothetical protein VGO62_06060 [Myxococcota bacterium]